MSKDVFFDDTTMNASPRELSGSVGRLRHKVTMDSKTPSYPRCAKRNWQAHGRPMRPEDQAYYAIIDDVVQLNKDGTISNRAFDASVRWITAVYMAVKIADYLDIALCRADHIVCHHQESLIAGHIRRAVLEQEWAKKTPPKKQTTMPT